MKPKTTSVPMRVEEDVLSKIREVAEAEDRTIAKQINRILKDWAKEASHAN